jgi:hypothetical protein
MNKPVGGRGKKAPYETVVMRVPVALVSKIDDAIGWYRDCVVNGIPTDNDIERLKMWESSYVSLDKEQAIEKAKQILKQKKSAKQSIIKLLQVIYAIELDEEISI